MTTALILHLPEDWTAQQALDIYELLHELADGIWDEYETPIIELIDEQSQEYDRAQRELLGFNDPLPF